MEDLKADLKLSTLEGKAGDAWARVVRSPKFAPALLAIILIWEFGALLFEASRTPFWYDELLTFHVSGLQPFALCLRALKAGADAMPPGYYVIMRAARLLPGDPLITLRLPSILGYLMTLLGVYWFVRKRLPAMAGLAAALLITLTPFREYATEARPYALLVGFLAIAAVLWQRIGEKQFMTPPFALFLALAVCCHPLAVVAIYPFGIAELTWTLMSRRIRWGVWAACLLATFSFFMNLPILLHYRDIFGRHFWEKSSLVWIPASYADYLGINGRLTFVLILFFVLVAGDSLLRMMRRPREGVREREFVPPEIILVSGFLFYPALLVVLTTLLGGGYTPRYGWPGILGLVIGSIYLVQTIWSKPTSAYLLVALLMGFGLSEFQVLSKARLIGVNEPGTVLAEFRLLAKLSLGEPNIPVVISHPHFYLEAAEYAPPELRPRLVYVADSDLATRLIGTDSGDKTTSILAQFTPLHVEDLAPFEAAYQRFILYTAGTSDWFTPYLIESGYHLRLLSTDVNIDINSKKREGPPNVVSQIYIAER